MHTLSSTSATKVLGSGDLVPLSSFTIQLVYGDLDYVKSVFGTTDINRYDLENYYINASKNWLQVKGATELKRPDIISWIRRHNLRGLEYWFPAGRNTIWFKNQEDAFMFKLEFGE